MLAFFYVSAYVVGLWAPFVAFHWHLHGPSLLQAALALFNAINVLICMWEISLFVHRHHVKRTYEQLRAKWGDRKLPVPMCLFEDITLRQALSLKHWSIIWSTYSLLDPSYSQHTSWGFWSAPDDQQNPTSFEILPSPSVLRAIFF